MLERGAVIHGFEIQGALRSGPRGVVYEAIQGSLRRPVALRMIDEQLSGDPVFVERFWQQRWPEHPHIVSVYEAGECEHGLFLAMQLIRGPTLAEALRGEPPALEVMLEVLGQLAEALDAAHADGLPHGWLRPEAVLIDEGARAWLSDFGLTPGAATIESDRAAFAALARTCLGRRAVPKAKFETASAVVAAIAARERPGDADSSWRRRMKRLVPPGRLRG